LCFASSGLLAVSCEAVVDFSVEATVVRVSPWMGVLVSTSFVPVSLTIRFGGAAFMEERTSKPAIMDDRKKHAKNRHPPQ
jgi:hypothetical protein